MSSILKVDTIQDQAGNNIINESGNVITIGASGDTITVPAGATVSGFTSAGIDDNATSVAVTIDSSERVGIGTTSPSQLLHVNGHIVGNSLNIPSNTGSPPSGVTIHKPANNTMAFRTNSSERMRLTDTGLSIGTTEASAPIDLKLSSSNTNSVSNVMQIRHNTSGTAAAGFGTNIAFNGERADGNDQAMGKIGFVATNNTSTDMSSAFTIDTANAGVSAERMRVEPSGRVRIANTSSTGHGNIYNLIVGNESSGGDAGVLLVSPNNENAYYGFGDSGGVPCSLNYNHGSNFLRTYVNGSEAMRIDSSGNFFVATTTEASDDVGHALLASGAAYHTADGTYVGLFNRKSSDGEIVQFRKDNTVIGRISSTSTGIALGTPISNGSGLHLITDAILPSTSTGGTADNGKDLGSSSSRFKDLYLGGGAFIGGTGAANKLDDYEEGTWSPKLGNETTAVYSNQTGWYRKIGETVFIYFSVSLSSKGDISGAYTKIANLPFNGASGGDRFGSGQIHAYRLGSSAHIQGIEFGGATVSVGWIMTGGGGTTGYLNTSFVADNTYFEGFAMYKTA